MDLRALSHEAGRVVLLVLLGHAVAAREELSSRSLFIGLGCTARCGLSLLDKIHLKLLLAQNIGVAAVGCYSCDRAVVVGT